MGSMAHQELRVWSDWGDCGYTHTIHTFDTNGKNWMVPTTGQGEQKTVLGPKYQPHAHATPNTNSTNHPIHTSSCPARSQNQLRSCPKTQKQQEAHRPTQLHTFTIRSRQLQLPGSLHFMLEVLVFVRFLDFCIVSRKSPVLTPQLTMPSSRFFSP